MVLVPSPRTRIGISIRSVVWSSHSLLMKNKPRKTRKDVFSHQKFDAIALNSTRNVPRSLTSRLRLVRLMGSKRRVNVSVKSCQYKAEVIYFSSQPRIFYFLFYGVQFLATHCNHQSRALSARRITVLLRSRRFTRFGKNNFLARLFGFP